MDDKPNLGISSCLLGLKVRYDGGHKLDRYLRDVLGACVNWIPVCPEVECGLPVPRESMRLVGDFESPRLVAGRSGTDHTERMMRWVKKRLDELAGMDLSGFVFKTRSPSSGIRDIGVYDESGAPQRKGPGLFARAFLKRFPLLPVEDEGRLNDPVLRENFIERIFVRKRWNDLIRTGFSMDGLVAFHTRHKLLIMSHSPAHLRELGRITASVRQDSLQAAADRYLEILMAALRLIATPKKNVNVLDHAMGYFKKALTADEKQELLELIGHYHRGLVPLVVPLTLLLHFIRKYDEPYLGRQLYFVPHPMELMLRNHV